MTKIWLSAYLLLALIYLSLVSFIQFPLTTLLKPLPIALLAILSAFHSDSAWLSKYLMFALLFSIGGDIALSIPMSYQLETGLGLFLMAHIFYIVIFSRNLCFSLSKALLSLLVILTSIAMYCFLFSYLGDLLIPVLVYMIVINSMAITAIGGVEHHWLAALGAVIFLLSDSLIALDEFVFPHMNFTLAIMASYYLAQLLIVTGVLKLFIETKN